MKTRTAVLNSARALFHAKGYADTSMDDIIRASGVAKGNVYYHFKGKEAVALAALENYKEIVMKASFPDDGTPPLEQVLRGIDGTVERMGGEEGCRKGCFFGNLALEMSPNSEPLRKSLEEYFSEKERRIRSLLVRAKKEGAVPRHVDPALAAEMMLGLLEGAALLSKVKRSPKAVRDAARFLKAYLRGEVAGR
ncbi:MAG: TetR/AcrR family transcriptional regulator [Nitrospinae bacterium]|nr:TetR/AcrR family transcriptional regulator [Nitrospinota bacterium]